MGEGAVEIPPEFFAAHPMDPSQRPQVVQATSREVHLGGAAAGARPTLQP
jgi:hypothetical protein